MHLAKIGILRLDLQLNPFLKLYSQWISSNFIKTPVAPLMATIIDIKIPKAIATALRIPQNNPQRQQMRVLKKLLKKARFTELGQ